MQLLHAVQRTRVPQKIEEAPAREHASTIIPPLPCIEKIDVINKSPWILATFPTFLFRYGLATSMAETHLTWHSWETCIRQFASSQPNSNVTEPVHPVALTICTRRSLDQNICKYGCAGLRIHSIIPPFSCSFYDDVLNADSHNPITAIRWASRFHFSQFETQTASGTIPLLRIRHCSAARGDFVQYVSHMQPPSHH